MVGGGKIDSQILPHDSFDPEGTNLPQHVELMNLGQKVLGRIKSDELSQF
jgi:hypothetical protein